MSEAEIEINFTLNDIEHPTKDGWMKADWLLTIGTLLEEGTFQGVKGPEITFAAPVIESIIQTAVNKPIHLFHRNKEKNKRDIGRIYGIMAENGKGKIKYITWDKESNEGINNGDYKLSMESKVFTASKEGKLDAIGGVINGAALVYTKDCRSCMGVRIFRAKMNAFLTGIRR